MVTKHSVHTHCKKRRQNKHLAMTKSEMLCLILCVSSQQARCTPRNRVIRHSHMAISEAMIGDSSTIFGLVSGD